ncbi:uncharacterized protein LOC127860548 isoform X2 [Dreissena polymorpha]|nr:uncharacterized protein LOC127860548 isoform X2 [Dreissena polymorpha]
MLFPVAHAQWLVSLLLLFQLLHVDALRTITEEIEFNGHRGKFASLIKTYNLSHHFERPGITVFVPVSSSNDVFLTEAAWFGYNTSDRATVESILLYHIADSVTSVADMSSRKSAMTPLEGQRRWYFGSYNYGDSIVHTVNGAWILTADILASNGIVHLVDRFLIPIQSNKTVADYLEHPDIQRFSFQSIRLASIIDLQLKSATNSSTNRFTVFAPNDSNINIMSDFGKDILFNDTALLKSVFWAHTIEDETVYIPRMGTIPNYPAKAGILKFYRVGSDVYVSNNKVRARVVQPNIPVQNGVIHVIDDLLFFVYRNLRQTIEHQQKISFIQGNLHGLDAEIVTELTDKTRKMTLFLPTDDAFAKLPQHKQHSIDNNGTHVSRLFQDHLIMYAERAIDSFQDGETFSTADGAILTVKKIQNVVYVEGGGVRAKVTTPDIGCTNGVIHLVNSVLFQRDFTIWDAIIGINQLSKMKQLISKNQDLMATLSATRNGPMTVFLISDAALNKIPSDTFEQFTSNYNLILDALHGSIAPGVILSSTQITGEMEVPTLAGKTITLHPTETGLFIIGSRIRADVVIEDIWCSNGVLHITDNLLHLPTRNIVNEMAVQPGLGVMAGIIDVIPSLKQILQDTSKTFTMFVPSDDAFTLLPTHRAQKLQDPILLQHIVRSHVILGSSYFLEQLRDYSKFSSLTGDPLFVLREQEKVFAVSCNVRGSVIRSDIRCSNGIIHVLDTLLQFPFWTVAETIEKTNNLLPFHDMIMNVDDLYTWSNSHDTNLTLLVPSAKFIASLSNFHRSYISAEPDMDRKLFNSHALPSITLNQANMDAMFTGSRVFYTENRYNTTFTFVNVDPTNRTEITSVDIGYTNLRRSFDLVRDGIACSNGIIYVIDGFLNFPLHDAHFELTHQPDISLGSDQLLKLITSDTGIDLTSLKTMYTVFVPSDSSLDPQHLSRLDLEYINTNLTKEAKMAIVRRHIVPNQKVDYDTIIDGSFSAYAGSRNITVVARTDGFYLRWEDIEAKIVKPNILAINAIIHVVDRFLMTSPYQTTTLPPPTSTTTQKPVSSGHTIHSSVHAHYAPLNIYFAYFICLVCSQVVKCLQVSR